RNWDAFATAAGIHASSARFQRSRHARARGQQSTFVLRRTRASQWLTAEEIVSERAAQRKNAASEPGAAERRRRMRNEGPPGFESGSEVLQTYRASGRIRRRPATFQEFPTEMRLCLLWQGCHVWLICVHVFTCVFTCPPAHPTRQPSAAPPSVAPQRSLQVPG